MLLSPCSTFVPPVKLTRNNEKVSTHSSRNHFTIHYRAVIFYLFIRRVVKFTSARRWMVSSGNVVGTGKTARTAEQQSCRTRALKQTPWGGIVRKRRASKRRGTSRIFLQLQDGRRNEFLVTPHNQFSYEHQYIPQLTVIVLHL